MTDILYYIYQMFEIASCCERQRSSQGGQDNMKEPTDLNRRHQKGAGRLTLNVAYERCQAVAGNAGYNTETEEHIMNKYQIYIPENTIVADADTGKIITLRAAVEVAATRDSDGAFLYSTGKRNYVAGYATVKILKMEENLPMCHKNGLVFIG